MGERRRTAGAGASAHEHVHIRQPLREPATLGVDGSDRPHVPFTADITTLLEHLPGGRLELVPTRCAAEHGLSQSVELEV